jgi:arylformamidase
MSFDDMPNLGAFVFPGAQEYADECIKLSRAVVPKTKHQLDIAYGPDFFQKLDLFLPDGVTDPPVPVLLFFHGGAWKNGYKEWLGFMAPPLVNLPAIFISANYRLAPTVRFPAPLDDCCDALAWVWKNISSYGGDPNRLYVGGHSAGGHLAALLTLRPELLRVRGLPADCVKACFPLSGAFNLERKNAGPGFATMLDLLLDAHDDGAAATPMNYAMGNRIPFYIAWGEKDLPDVSLDNDAMAKCLSTEKGVVAQHVFAGNSHFDTNLGCANPDGPWVRTVRQWMMGLPGGGNP